MVPHRAELDSVARHITSAVHEIRELLRLRGQPMPEAARDALAEMALALVDLADDANCDHASGLMCEVVESLKAGDGGQS